MPISSDDVKRGILAAKAEAARRRWAKAQQQVLVAGKVSAAFSQATASKAEEKYLAHGRTSVPELIVEHAEQLAALRSAVCDDPLFDPKRHDEIWLLRFVLSHKSNIPASASAVRGCLAFRKQHNMDDPNLPICGPAALEVPEVAKLFSLMASPAAQLYYTPDANRGAILIITPAMVNTHAIIDNLSIEEHFLEQRLAAEWLFRQGDETTRRTGYLTKYVRLVNLDGMTLSKLNRDFMKRLAAIAGQMEESYPQMLGRVFVCNAPGWMYAVFRTMRPLLPARVVEKVDFLAPRRHERDRDRLLQHVALEDLPEFLGGARTTWPPPNARFAP